MDEYKKGQCIKSLEELSQQDFFYIQDRFYKNGYPIALNSPQLDEDIKKGLIYKAIKIRKVRKNGRTKKRGKGRQPKWTDRDVPSFYEEWCENHE